MKKNTALHFFIALILLFVASFSATAEDICTNTTSTNTSGVLYDSGGSKKKYNNNENCGFLIQPTGDWDITLSFSEFDYEDFFDYVYVYDGVDTNGVLLGQFTGAALPADLTATSGAMYIVHSTDFSIKQSGFAATWSSSPSLNLIAEWHFDEPSWDGSLNEVIDNRGNINGFSVNGANTINSGQVCGAASFDGTDDYLTMADIDTPLSSTASLSFWIKTSQSGHNTMWTAPGITGVEQAGGGNDIFWGWLDLNGRIGITTANGNKAQSTAPINNNTWQHIVLTRNSTSGRIEVYVNGTLNSSVIGTQGDITTAFNSIGRIEDTGGTPRYLSGQLDEMLIFASVINADQVTSIYNNQQAGKSWDGSERNCDPVLVAEWRLEETSWTGAVDEVIDSTGNNYHGQRLTNASPSDTLPAISGAEGTCAYGRFSSGSIAIDGLPLSTSSGEKTTVSFWMRWDGTNGSMPIGWSYYDLWFYNGSFGFNTWNNDVYGVSSAGLQNTWRHITAEFTNGSGVVTSNRLWIDGVEQTLGQRIGSPTTAYRSVGSALRIGGAVNSNSYFFHGSIDEVRVYSHSLNSSQIATIMNATHPCGNNTVGYFSITHDNSAVYCLDETMSVTARNEDTSTLTAYNDTITLDTQTNAGTWSLVSGNGVFNDAISDDGLATYTFADTDNGTASFSLYYNAGSQTINVDAYDSNARDDDTEGDLVFSATGFSVTSTPLSNPPVTPINDPISTQISAQAFSIAIAAYGINPEDGQCGIIETYAGSKSLSLLADYRNPDAGTLQVSGSGAVNFIAGQAVTTTQYNDVGEIVLNVSDVASGIAGQSNPFVVRPSDFLITVNNNPATTSNGSGFISAGADFTVSVQALNAAGNPTPNYGNETLPESVNVALENLVFPTGGNVGALSNGNSFIRLSNNLFENTTLSWSEVGSIRLSASVADGDYLGVGNITSTPSTTVGRFYPNNFSLNTAAVTNSCDNFTYLSEPELSVAYTLSAIDEGGNILSNYDEGLGYPVGSIAYTAEVADSGNNISARLSTATSVWQAGEYILLDSNAIFARTSTREAPLNDIELGIVVNDIDSVGMNAPAINAQSSGDCSLDNSCNASLLGTASFYYGRVSLSDAYGPETADLPVSFITEYWTGQRFVNNIYDDCTAIPRSRILFNGGDISLAQDLSINLVGGITTAQFASLSSASVGFVSGDAGFVFSAPGADITLDSFTVDVDLTALDWLRFDWDQDGNDNNDARLPTATMRFKSYRGHDRILYWRHKY